MKLCHTSFGTVSVDLFYKLDSTAICILTLILNRNLWEDVFLRLAEQKVCAFFVQLTNLAIFKMSYLAKLCGAKFIKGLKMCGWFICGNCANVARTFFLNRKEKDH